MKRAFSSGPVPAPGAGSRWTLMVLAFLPLFTFGQGGDAQLRVKADALFAAGSYAQALPIYSQLVSLEPGDHDLNYRLGACSLYGGDDKEKAIGYLKFAVQGPATDNLAWYFLGRAYHLDYQFDAAIAAYGHFRGTADRKLLGKFPVDDLAQQCRNGKELLGNIKDIKVFNKVEVAASDFFRFYDLSDIGGKIVTTPDELMTSLDRKSKERSLVYLPSGGGTIYFSSYGKDGKTGRDIYRTEVLPTGGFSDPVKLVGYVNTDEDEDYAVMGPDGKTFYFCSKGHNSMGGYDVFKSSYDKVSGIFGPPENMDFAVNTPADEMLYIVGPDGKQACFASTRESRQDMETVYRVGTTPAPVNLTVIKGTFASAFDITDHKAHIVVEDALTREKVADVMTDVNGGYLIALPHGGRYSILVEGGPDGKTHLGVMDVPSGDRPSAYAQEIKLVNGGGEKLSITDHFDQPLQDDVLALAMDEIRRRAKLDITEGKVMAAAPGKDTEDPMDVAGFPGNMTVDDALKLAKGQQDDLAQRAARQGREADAAFVLAASNLDAAETSSALAQNLVQQAGAVAEGTGRDALMKQAAEARQRAKEASERAGVAFSVGHLLGAAQQTALVQATQAAKTSVALAHALEAKDTAATIGALKEVKAQADQQTGPDATLSEDERARRVASDAEKAAAGELAKANAERGDELALADRIARMKHDMAKANRKKKDELQQQVATLEAQHAALLEETEAAFAKAQRTAANAARARGQVALLRYIQADSAAHATPTPMPDLTGMEQRMTQVKAGIAALAIDQRYDASVTEPVAVKERRTFDWGISTNDLAQAGNAGSTGAHTPTVPTTVATQAASDMAATSTTANGSGARSTPPVTAAAMDGKNDLPDQGTASSGTPVQTVMADGTAPAGPIPVPGGESVHQDPGPNGERPATIQDTLARAQNNGPGPAIAVDPSEEAAPNGGLAKRDDGAISDMAHAATGHVEDAEGGAKAPAAAATVNDVDQEMFFASNKLAELKQLRLSAAKKAERDSLDGEIHAQQEQMSALQRRREELDARKEQAAAVDVDDAATPIAQVDAVQPDASDTAGASGRHGQADGGPLRYTLLDNDPTVLSEQSVDDIMPGFTLRQQRIAAATGNEKGKAIARHQLEKELVDSIDAHIARQTAFLAQHPGSAAAVQPAIDHLHALKAQHVKAAEEALAVVREDQAPSTGSSSPAVPLAQGPVSADRQSGPIAGPAVPAPDMSNIYERTVTYRSPKAREAAVINAGELQQAKAELARIDSLEELLGAAPEGDARDDLQKRTDKAKDDLLILRSEIGERTGFIMKEEYATVQDSAAGLDRAVKGADRPANGSLAAMATGFVQTAQVDWDHGALLRKNAARTSDIVARDSLYRLAYANELRALGKLDQAITVRIHMMESGPEAGEEITYAEVERRLAQGPSAVADLPVQTAPDTAAVANDTDAGNALAATGDPTAAAPRSDSLRTGTTPVPEPVLAEIPDGPSPKAPTGESGTGGSVSEALVGTDMGSPSVNADGGTIAAAGSGAAGPLSRASDTKEDGTPVSAKGNSNPALPGLSDTAVVKMMPERREPGQGQYFMLRSKARDGRQASDAALADAAERTDQAWKLKNQAAALSGSGGHEAEVARLSTLSTALFSQADSLRIVAQGLAGSAANYDGQAAAYLAGIPPEQARALKAMEGPGSAPAPLETAPAISIPEDQAIAEPPVPDAEQTRTSDQEAPEETAAPVVPEVEAESPTVGPVPSPVAVVTAPSPLRPSTSFAVGPDVAPRQAAIPMDVAMPKGLVYMVQVGAFRNELPAKAFQDITPVSGIHVGNGLVRYSAGRFEDRQEAVKAQDQIRARGYKDAFVVAYMDGQRITLRQAEDAQGTGAGATVSPATPVAKSAVTITRNNGGGTAVLADYPSSAQAVLADFHPMPATDNYYNDPKAAPAKQVETVKGLFFTVQVGVYSRPTALDRLFNITPLNTERTANDKIRYTTGIYRDLASASTRKNTTVALGVTDAFVTAYLNGKRIPLGDARALLAKLGPSVLVDPQLATPQ